MKLAQWLFSKLRWLFIPLLGAVCVMGFVKVVDGSVENVRVSGSFTYLTPQEIESSISKLIVDSFLSGDLVEIQTKVARHPWIKSVEVRREWPRTLSFTILEHTPLAIWYRKGVISRSGDALKLDQVPEISGLPTVVVEEKDLARAMQLYVLVAEQLVLENMKISRFEYDQSIGVKVSLYTGATLMLGKESVVERLNRVLVLMKADSILHDAVFDARYVNGVAVKDAAALASN